MNQKETFNQYAIEHAFSFEVFQEYILAQETVSKCNLDDCDYQEQFDAEYV